MFLLETEEVKAVPAVFSSRAAQSSSRTVRICPETRIRSASTVTSIVRSPYNRFRTVPTGGRRGSRTDSDRVSSERQNERGARSRRSASSASSAARLPGPLAQISFRFRLQAPGNPPKQVGAIRRARFLSKQLPLTCLECFRLQLA